MARSPSTTLAPKVRAPRADARWPRAPRVSSTATSRCPIPSTSSSLRAAGPMAYAESVVQRLDLLSRTEYRTLHTLADKTFLRQRRHLLGVLGPRGSRSHLSVRSDSAHSARYRVAQHREGTSAAHPRAERVPARRLRAAAHPRRPRGTARDGGDLEGVPPRDVRGRAAARCARAYRRRGPDPR